MKKKKTHLMLLQGVLLFFCLQETCENCFHWCDFLSHSPICYDLLCSTVQSYCVCQSVFIFPPPPQIFGWRYYIDSDFTDPHETWHRHGLAHLVFLSFFGTLLSFSKQWAHFSKQLINKNSFTSSNILQFKNWHFDRGLVNCEFHFTANS